MRRLSLSLFVLSVSLLGCSKHASDTTGPPPAAPVPGLVATQPPARSPSALYDGGIWAQFDRPLDPRTVNTLNVYLKLDAQRTPITVSYDAGTHRVTLTPTVTLELKRTYTVEFSTAVKGADGTPLPPGVFFQFTTNSLRHPVYDFPLQDATEGPVATLCWGGTQGPTNNVRFDLYVSPDSNAVQTRTAPVLHHSVLTRFVPSDPWPLGTRVYWALTSENLTTHERLDGEVHSFVTVDPQTPIETLTIRGRDHGSRSSASNTQGCNAQVFNAGGLFNAALHWDLASLPPDIRIQSVEVRMNLPATPVGSITSSKPSLWIAQNDWVACQMTSPGPPFNETSGFLVTAVAETPTTALYSSTRLAGLFEALYRNRTLLFGTLVRADNQISFQSTSSADDASRPTALVRFYRLPAVAQP